MVQNVNIPPAGRVGILPSLTSNDSLTYKESLHQRFWKCIVDADGVPKKKRCSLDKGKRKAFAVLCLKPPCSRRSGGRKHQPHKFFLHFILWGSTKKTMSLCYEFSKKISATVWPSPPSCLNIQEHWGEVECLTTQFANRHTTRCFCWSHLPGKQ